VGATIVVQVANRNSARIFYEWDRRIWRRAKGAAATPMEDNQISTRLSVYNNIQLIVLIHVGDKDSCRQSSNANPGTGGGLEGAFPIAQRHRHALIKATSVNAAIGSDHIEGAVPVYIGHNQPMIMRIGRLEWEKRRVRNGFESRLSISEENGDLLAAVM